MSEMSERDADPVIDRNVAARSDVALWNETRWNGCWNPTDGVGIYLHAGRFRRVLSLWWAQVVAYLPDQQLCVQRLWGRNPASAGVEMAGLVLEVTENGWTASYDGAGELTSVGEMSRGVHGASAPTRSFSFELTATPATAPWDLFDGRKPDGDTPAHAGDAHLQQGFLSSGTLRVADREHPLTGIGFKDHSSGKRDFSGWHSHQFVLIVAPDWTAHLISMAKPDGSAMPPLGALIRRDGAQTSIARFELPKLATASGGPTEGELEFETTDGQHFRFACELIHGAPLSITEDNDNMNGVNWTIDGDPVVLVEGNAKLTAPDGSVVHCFHERSMRRSQLPAGEGTDS